MSKIRPGQLQENVLYNISASYVTSAQSASYILAANIDQPFTTVSASGILNNGGGNFIFDGNGDDINVSAGTSAFVVDSEALFNNGVSIDLSGPFTSQLIVSGGRVDLRNAQGVSGSFSGSFQGDGTNITGVTAEWDGSHLGNASITGSLILSGSLPLLSLPDAPKAAIVISGSNDGTRLRIYDTEDNLSPVYTEGAGIVLTGGEGAAQSILEMSAVGSANGGSNNEQTFIRSSETLNITAAAASTGQNIKIRGTAWGWNLNSSNSGTDLIFITNGGATRSTLELGTTTGVAGTGVALSSRTSAVDFTIVAGGNTWLDMSSTKATFIADVSSSAASTASFGTYLGDGSQLSGISTTPFPFVGDAVITGSLVVSGSGINVTSGSITGDGSGLTNIGSTSLNNITLGNSTIVGDGASSATSYGNAFGKSATSAGGQNVAIGAFSNVKIKGISIGHSVAGGEQTVAIGYNAGHTSGEYNVLIGQQPGNNTSGNYNISLGYLAGFDQTTGTGNITIGSGSRGLAGESNQLRIGHGLHGATISASLDTGDIIFASTASAAYFVGDGSQLSGINSSTSLTQSLFVSPSGNDGTAIVGDLHSPFQTILAATASANPGDTIIVYPGVYFPSAQIGKDYINYYFYPGAIVSGSIQLLSGTYEKLNIRGHGTFKTKYNGAPVGCTANGYFECDTVEFAGLQSSGYAGSPTFAQNVSADPKGILQLRGDYKYGLDNSARVGNSFNAAMRFGAGNIIANCNCFVSSSSNMMGIEIATTTTTDVIFNGDVYASNGRAVYTNDRASHVTLTGRFETGNQATYEAIYLVPAYVGRYIVNGEIIGAIRIDAGEVGDSGIQIDGFQVCSSSPNASAIKIDGGYNTLNHTIRASEVIFDVNGGETHFYGAAYVSSNSTGKLFDISAGKFVWNGMNTGTNIRALSNVVSGGELVINGPLEHYGSSYPNNTECFALSGGTLEINNKVRYHQNTTGSGIVDMSGGYLKLNGAELVHNDGTGSYAPAINLNSGNYSGSILNNSYTNLNVFGNLGTFTNESIGGGTLFYNDKLY